MTDRNQPGSRFEFTIDEVDRIGNSIGPKVREKFKEDLRDQTADIRKIVKEHEGNIKLAITEHEKNDLAFFEKIEKRLGNGDTRMGRIESKIIWFSGAIAGFSIIAGGLLWKFLEWKSR